MVTITLEEILKRLNDKNWRVCSVACQAFGPTRSNILLEETE